MVGSKREKKKIYFNRPLTNTDNNFLRGIHMVVDNHDFFYIIISTQTKQHVDMLMVPVKKNHEYYKNDKKKGAATGAAY